MRPLLGSQITGKKEPLKTLPWSSLFLTGKRRSRRLRSTPSRSRKFVRQAAGCRFVGLAPELPGSDAGRGPVAELMSRGEVMRRWRKLGWVVWGGWFGVWGLGFWVQRLRDVDASISIPATTTRQHQRTREAINKTRLSRGKSGKQCVASSGSPTASSARQA